MWLMIFVISTMLLFHVGRRRFARRNAFGVEEFRNYGHAVGASLYETLLVLVGSIGFLVGFVGMLV